MGVFAVSNVVGEKNVLFELCEEVGVASVDDHPIWLVVGEALLYEDSSDKVFV